MLLLAMAEAGAGPWNQPVEKAGSIKKIKVENFMCHASLSIDLIDRVNFITGQNGSGKSAILTALCVAFGIKARGTQRASSLKDFIKNGQTSGSVVVDIKNEGPDAFKPDLYGAVIIVERRITESGQSFTMKDERGRKVATKREDLQELMDHFNIDVENPCVIMTQDQSREFLHVGSGKEKFKFFFKATLLQQVHDLLKVIGDDLENAKAVIEEFEKELQPYLDELKVLEEQIKSVQQVELLTQQAVVVKKKLAWSYVYSTQEKIQVEELNLEKFQRRVPTCQKKIDEAEDVACKVREATQLKKASISDLLEALGQSRHSQNVLGQELSEATRERAGLEEDLNRKQREIARSTDIFQKIQGHAREICERHVQSTQAEESEREQQFMGLNQAIESKRGELLKLSEEETDLQAKVDTATEQIKGIQTDLDEIGIKLRDTQGYLHRLSAQRKDVVTAFGGEKILQLLRAIKQQHRNFISPPIGPIGSHITLAGDDTWSLAIEVAVGKLFNAFVVTNHPDMLLLRKCAQRSNCGNIQIIINDFNRPPIQMPQHMLPDPSLVTVMSVLQTENHVIMNTLIDQGHVERQVLARDYEEGKRYAFGRSHLTQNVKEVLTMDGLKLFTRVGSETTLPRDRRTRGRLGVRIEDQLREANAQVSELNETLRTGENHKRSAGEYARNFHSHLQQVKRRKVEIQRSVTSQERRLQDLQDAARAESELPAEPDDNELEEDMARIQEDIQGNENMLVKLKIKFDQAEEKVAAARARFDGLRKSARGDIEATESAEQELMSLEEELTGATKLVRHFQRIMQDKVLADISKVVECANKLKEELEKNRELAAQVCPEDDVTALGGVDQPQHELSALLGQLQARVRREEQENEPLEVLEKSRDKLKERAFKKGSKFSTFDAKLKVLTKAFEVRCEKFNENVGYLCRQLTWQFNRHLRKKGFAGSVKVDSVAQTLSLEVQMPQDASNSAVRDTRALSGGERSYSTLSFALALHEMTEAPFRAMDEFDVFMDAVSRKISLDSVVEFAVQQGSQWIFITPHDISSVKAGEFVRKQQMAAPRH